MTIDLPGWLTFLPGGKSFKRKSLTKQTNLDAVIILDAGDMSRNWRGLQVDRFTADN